MLKVPVFCRLQSRLVFRPLRTFAVAEATARVVVGECGPKCCYLHPVWYLQSLNDTLTFKSEAKERERAKEGEIDSISISESHVHHASIFFFPPSPLRPHFVESDQSDGKNLPKRLKRRSQADYIPHLHRRKTSSSTTPKPADR